MTDASLALAAAAGERRSIVGLAVGQVLVWSAFFYLFPALMLRWERDLGWSKPGLAAAFTGAVLVSAIAAPFFGRVIDAGRGRALLAVSAAAGGLMVIALALVDSLPLFYALWLAIGVAMGGSLYEPCFAYVTRVCGLRARGAITLITLVAGFAGTLTFPLATGLADGFGWRWAALTFGLAALLLAAPLFWWAGGRLERGLAAAPEEADSADGSVGGGPTVRSILGNPTFWFLSIAFALMMLDHSLLLNHLLALLDWRGVEAASAVLLASLIGPMQVAGRLALFLAGQRGSTLFATYACFLSVLAAAVVLCLSGTSFVLLLLFVALQGAGLGVSSIMRPVATAEFLGRARFGLVFGLTAMAFLAAMAFGPLLGSLVWQRGGYALVQWTVVAIALLSLVSLVAAQASRRRR